MRKALRYAGLSACRKTNFGTSRTPSPTKAFTKNSQIVGAGVLDSPIIGVVWADAHISPIDQRNSTGRCGHRPLHFQFITYAANSNLGAFYFIRIYLFEISGIKILTVVQLIK